MKKTVAIIGAAGSMGSAIALGLAATGYRVLLTDDIEHYSLLYMKLTLRERKIRLRVPEADVDIVLSAREASWEADIIILAIPYETQIETACKIKDVVTGKVVICLANPLTETHNSPVTAPTNSAAKELAQILPHSKIVQAFSTIVADQPGELRVTGMSVDVFVDGDDDEAVSTVMQLAKDVGYHPLVAEKLDGPVEQPVRTPRSSDLN
jgi:predicted dinucleotide-binding enzyme